MRSLATPLPPLKALADDHEPPDRFGLLERLVVQVNADDVDENEPVAALRAAAECTLPSLDHSRQLRLIMDCLFPPQPKHKPSLREKTSITPATRLDLLALNAKVEATLAARSAKLFGICAIRRRIFDELFGGSERVQTRGSSRLFKRSSSNRQFLDELLRQVTINCAERGLLLSRARAEVTLTMLAYESLLESTIGYGAHKAMLAEDERNPEIVDVKRLKAVNDELRDKVCARRDVCRVERLADRCRGAPNKSRARRTRRAARTFHRQAHDRKRKADEAQQIVDGA